jgi:glutaredoxin-like protein
MAQMLNDDVQKQVRDLFANLQNPVEILFFGSQESNCEYCEETGQLLEEVSALSDKITLDRKDWDTEGELASRYGVELVPGTVIGTRVDGEFKDYGIRFAGIPAGHEFTSLIRDIMMVGLGDSGLSEDTREYLANLQEPVTLQVFVTPTCPYCPQAVVLAHQMAMESPLVQAEMVEAMEFPELSDQFGVSGVPHTVINEGASEVVGAVPEQVLLQHIQQMVLDEV